MGRIPHRKLSIEELRLRLCQPQTTDGSGTTLARRSSGRIAERTDRRSAEIQLEEFTRRTNDRTHLDRLSDFGGGVHLRDRVIWVGHGGY